MGAFLHGPVSAGVSGQLCSAGLPGVQASGRVDGLAAETLGIELASSAHDLQDLGHVRKERAGHRDELYDAHFLAAVTATGTPVQYRDLLSQQGPELRGQAGLIRLDRDQIVRPTVFDQVAGSLALGITRAS